MVIGAVEAEAHLSELLDRVAAGEEITITKGGRPVARLVGTAGADRSRVEAVFARLREMRKGKRLGDLDWKELRDIGRR
jgi:prevent-host-death family protein